MLEIFKQIPNLLPAIVAASGIVSSTLLALHRVKKIEKEREVARERYTFLVLNNDVEIISNIGDLALVSIIIKLENKGKSKIVDRRKEHLTEYLKDKYGDFLYDDEWDQCEHAGTLKIRKVPDNVNAHLFDWYSLLHITDMIFLKDKKRSKRDFEQINYLDEYEKPPELSDVVFWMEPYETYRQQVMVFLPRGIYVIKAFFLGSYIGPPEDEYWSCTKLIKIM